MTRTGPQQVDKFVGARVRLARTLANMSQEKLGEKLGVTFQQVQKYEKGVNRIGSSRMVQIAATFKRPVSWFFDGATEESQTGDARDLVTEMLGTAQGLALAEAFLAIERPQQRGALVSIAQGLSGSAPVRARQAALHRPAQFLLRRLRRALPRRGGVMRAITIWQPWASLIMVGAKPNEFRPKPFTAYSNAPGLGEKIVIHAGARSVKPAEVEDLLRRIDRCDPQTGLDAEKARTLLLRVRAAHKYRLLPLAAALGTACLGEPLLACDLFKMKVEDSDRGDFNWAWPLFHVSPFREPVPIRGFQGFWNYPERIVA
jgi:transcriptional regulator with XRE-family HTH domain